MKLPVPTKAGLKKVSLPRPKTSRYLECFRLCQQGKVSAGLLELLVGTKAGDRKLDKSELRLIPHASIEVMVLQVLKNAVTEQKLSGVYTCPECNTPHVLRNEKDGEDNRIDLSEIDILYADSYDDAKVILDIEKKSDQVLLPFKQNEEAGRISGWTFDVFTLADHIAVENDQSLRDDPFRITARLLFMNLENLRGDYTESHPGTLTDAMKNRYKHEVMDFPNIRHRFDVMEGAKRYGLDAWTPELYCGNCAYVWREPIDFTNFFVSALRSISEGTARLNGHPTRADAKA